MTLCAQVSQELDGFRVEALGVERGAQRVLLGRAQQAPRHEEFQKTLVRKAEMAIGRTRKEGRGSQFEIHAVRIVPHLERRVAAYVLEQIGVVDAVAGTAPQKPG